MRRRWRGNSEGAKSKYGASKRPAGLGNVFASYVHIDDGSVERVERRVAGTGERRRQFCAINTGSLFGRGDGRDVNDRDALNARLGRRVAHFDRRFVPRDAPQVNADGVETVDGSVAKLRVAVLMAGIERSRGLLTCSLSRPVISVVQTN